MVAAARQRREAVSVALLGNIADVLPELHRRGVAIDVAHRPDLGPRLATGLHPAGILRGRGGRVPPARSGRL